MQLLARTAPRLRPSVPVPVARATMSMPSAAAPTSNGGGRTEVKILMLHGYTQSGAVFRVKTRAIEKLLSKTLAPAGLAPVLLYATAPNRLLPSDIPGHPSADADADADADARDGPLDAWAWFRKDDASGEYRFLDEGMTAVADAVRRAGGVDGVCGFSQGGALAGLVTAAVESHRPLPDSPAAIWARRLREANAGRPLKFAAIYSGFFSPVDSLAWCYHPKIKTPTLHYIGSLDTVVDESRSRALIDRCENPVIVFHPGGHHVPVAKEWVIPLAALIKQHATEAKMHKEEL